MSHDADALWRQAVAEVSPFARQRLFEQAATVLITTTGPKLRRFCARLLAGNESAAEDVAQRAFMTFWTVLPRFAGRSTLETFLFGIAQNLCRRSARDEGRSSRIVTVRAQDIRDEVHPDQLVDIDEARTRADRLRIVENALATMEPKDAWLLRARLVDDQPYTELLGAYRARFGDHIGTVEGLRTAFFHARRRLERLIGEAS